MPCYFRNGTRSTYTPCYNDKPSACCNGPRDVCRQDGLCFFMNDGVIWLDGCSDPTWQTNACSPLCPSAYQPLAFLNFLLGLYVDVDVLTVGMVYVLGRCEE
jgi:hypothetical protein